MCQVHYRWWLWDNPNRDAACYVPGCGRRVVARGWCSHHHRRWRLTGDPEEVLERRKPGRSEREPKRPGPKLKPRPGPNPDLVLGSEPVVGYTRSRYYLREARGSASDHPCAWPDCDRRAARWALDRRQEGLVLHYDRDPSRSDPTPVAYSVNPDDYIPLCRSHHIGFLRPPAPPRPVRPPAVTYTVCAVEGCGRKVKNPSNPLCDPHYRRQRLGMPLGPVGKRNVRRATVAKGLCKKHYWRQRRANASMPVP
jgi:hypothetical protein